MSDETRWTLIQDAAGGDSDARAEFTRRYLPAVRSYLRARWSGRLAPESLEDVVQEVFVEFLKDGGVLANARREGTGDFRALLYGVVRNVARREETRRARLRDVPSDKTFYGEEHEADEPTLSRVFDRAWAQAVMKEARDLQSRRAQDAGQKAMRRVELLRLRFQDGLPIREIARLWSVEAEALHREYPRAVRDFERALRDVVREQCPGSPSSIDLLCRDVLALLQ